MRKLSVKIFALSLFLLVGFGTANVKAAETVPSTITSIAINPSTPVKVVNSYKWIKEGQTLEFDLLDQNGNPVSVGNYTGNLTVNGPAYFIVDHQITQTAELKVKDGKGKITLFITNYFLPGEITITPHFRNLLNRTFTEKLYIPGIAGNATQVVLASQPSATNFSVAGLRSYGTEPFLTYSLQAEDAQDNITALNAPSGFTATVTYDGKPSNAIVVAPIVSTNGTYTLPIKLSETAAQGANTIPAGTYTVTITPDATARTTFATLTEIFTVTNPGIE